MTEDMTDMKNSILVSDTDDLRSSDMIKYSLGGLMYTPAHNSKVSSFITDKKYEHLRSLALCLEDAIADGTEDAAIEQIGKTFSEIRESAESGIIIPGELPYMFVRVKSPDQIERVAEITEYSRYLTGFIFPKFDIQNAQTYLETLSKINQNVDNILYGMPILESRSVLDIRNRINTLSEIKDITDSYRDNIINIRIGGNDFCSRFGVRRNITDSIYDIAAVSSVIGDIVNIFSGDYVVSAPVWDYFSNGNPGDTAWSDGLRNEIKKDILNGLTGKTAIHPSQLAVIDEELAVSEEDYADAVSILGWNDSQLAVAKGISGNRMNEEKVHRNWAEKIVIRAFVYGIRYTERNMR